MNVDDPSLKAIPTSGSAALTAARALLVTPQIGPSSPLPALGSAFAAACAALIAAACVILYGPSLGDPSHAVRPAVNHLVGG